MTGKTSGVCFTWAAWLVAAALAGCGLSPAEQERLIQEARRLDQENQALRRELLTCQAQVRAKDRQIATLQALGPERLERLFLVDSIELGRYTGGVNLDDKPGDDGIRVYLMPKDRHRHTITAAGSVTVRLFDLAQSPDNLVGTYEFPVEKIADHWAAGFLTFHYKFDCPWKGPPPKNPGITARVEFVDCLTGKTFAAQKLCQVQLPPAK